MRLVPIIFWIMLVSAKLNARAQRETYFQNTNTCVGEYSHDTSPLKEDSKIYFHPGESETVKCNGPDKDWSFDHNNYPSQFMVYPQPVRECRSGGTWSDPIPICIFRHNNFSSLTKAKVEPKQVTDSSLKTSHSSIEEWHPIGELHQQCSSLKKQSNVRNQSRNYEFIFSFHRPYFFSFAIISNADVNSVQLFAKKDGILKNISQEGRTFLQNHYGKWQKATKESYEKQCPIINTPVYTDQLKVQYSVALSKEEFEEIPSLSSKDGGPANISFFRIVKCYESEEDDHQQTCPEPPIILNATFERNNSDAINFICNDGYTMVDPVTDRRSSGIINCIEGDWFPYPYPVCKRHIPQISTILPPMSHSVIVASQDSNETTFIHDTFAPKNDETTTLTTRVFTSQKDTQSNITFIITQLCLLVLGFISSATIMIVCIRWRRKISTNGEKTQAAVIVEEPFIHPGFWGDETRVNYDIQPDIDVPSSLESDFSEFSQASIHEYHYPTILFHLDDNC